MAHARRDRHDRDGGEATDHARQRALHAGDHHDRIGGLDVVEASQEAVEAGDTDVGHPVGRETVCLEGHDTLVDHGDVAGAGTDDEDARSAVRLGSAPQQAPAPSLGAGMRSGHCCGDVVADPREQHGSAVPRQEFADDGDALVGRLALAVDGLGHALPQGPVVVDEGVAHLGERETPQSGHGIVGRDRSRAHTLDQIGQCRLVHLTILPDAPRNSFPGPAMNSSPNTGPWAIALPSMTSAPSPDTSTALVRVGFLDPLGTFTEQALKSQPDLAAAEHVLYRTMPDVLDAVDAGEVDLGFVAIENSIEGTVNLSQDELAFNHSLLIQREVVLDIEHCLMARPGLALADVQAVYSQPVATAQCHAFLRNNVGGAPVRATNSTAEAARLVAEEAPAGSAAVAPRASAALYGLEILAADIADHPGNQTRFVVVAREGVPAPTGHDRTAVVVYQRADEPGSLISILQEFAARRINLSNLLSRPTKDGGLGDYCFIIYADGHIADELMADALRSLRSKHGSVKFLGSYPAAGDHAGPAREHADARWREADDWVESLRSGIR